MKQANQLRIGDLFNWEGMTLKVLALELLFGLVIVTTKTEDYEGTAKITMSPEKLVEVYQG